MGRRARFTVLVPVDAVWQSIEALSATQLGFPEATPSTPLSQSAQSTFHRCGSTAKTAVAWSGAWFVEVVHGGGGRGGGSGLVGSTSWTGVTRHRGLETVLEVGEEWRQLRKHERHGGFWSTSLHQLNTGWAWANYASVTKISVSSLYSSKSLQLQSTTDIYSSLQFFRTFFIYLSSLNSSFLSPFTLHFQTSGSPEASYGVWITL